MLVVTEHRVASGDDFPALARTLLDVLAGAAGFCSGSLARSPDDPAVYLLTTRWLDAGSMRRALGSYDAKVAAAPLMASATDRPSVFEVLLESTAAGTAETASDLAQP